MLSATRPLRLAFATLAALALPASGAAHTRSQSFSTWTHSGDELRAVFSVASREVTRLAPLEGAPSGLDALLTAHARARIEAWAGDVACERVSGPTPLAARPGFQRFELRLRCPGSQGLRIRIGTFFEVAPSHVHFARVRGAASGSVEYLFTASRHELELASSQSEARAGGAATFGGWVRLGVEHIAGGLDHVAFLLALLLLCERLSEVALIATGFTLGHSLTLTLAVLGLVRPDADLVEALIGFTIALVAAENIGVRNAISRRLGIAIALALGGLAVFAVRHGDGAPALALSGLALFGGCYMSLVDTPERARRVRPALTLAFGLVHGFGFASQLLAIGIPGDRLLAALFGFNLGVEVGQLAIVAALWSAGALLLARWPGFPRPLALELASASLCGLGLYWFAERAYG